MTVCRYAPVRPGALRRLAAVLLVLPLVAACDIDELLEVSTPSTIAAAGIYRPENAQLLLNSAIGDFECAFGAYVAIGGLIGDEFLDATQTANRYPYDRRDMQPFDTRYATGLCEDLAVYSTLQTARVQSEKLLMALEGWTDQEVPNRQLLMATAAAYAGYSRLLLGEGFCSTVFTQVDPANRVELGGEISPDSAFRAAASMFQRSIDLAAQSTAGAPAQEIRNMALVGLARAQVNLGNYAAAQSAAEQVPVGFVRNMTASGTDSRRQNRVWDESSSSGITATVNTLYVAMDDPRVPFVDLGRNYVTGVPLIHQAKYVTADSPIPIASDDEARLIAAEAEIAIGDVQAGIDIINALRAESGLGPLSAATQAEAMAILIDERRKELFLEGQHLGDYIRFELPFVPAPGEPYHGSGVYGSQRCLPLPNAERLSNPNVPDQG